MLVLFETPAGYALFKLLNEKKLTETDNLYHDFETPERANKVVKLKHFEKFLDTTEALAATTAAVEGKMSSSLKKMLKKQMGDKLEQLLVADSKLGISIKDKLSLTCVSNSAVLELMRCIRSQLEGLLAGLPKKEMAAMALGLAHSLSRYKLKFSPDKVDTMIIQAVCLLDDLDKELNNYTMRCREWYGWHFPELGKIIVDNISFVKTVQLVGTRDNAGSTDLSDILPEDIEEKVKEAAEISMGTEVSEDDIENIQHLCKQVIDISSYRAQLYDYLRARMMAMAPNLTVLVGDLVGARLISHAGSLINLAKHPASTVQILGAEKALFRALKTKRDTPKYGLIYHSQLVSQTSTKNKGKMSRMLAAKASLATRVDALGEETSIDLGAEHKSKLEARMRLLEEGNVKRISGTAKAKNRFEKYHSTSEVHQYPAAADSTLPTHSKRKHEDIATPKKSLIEELDSSVTGDGQPKKKKFKVEVKEEENEESPKKKKKKRKSDAAEFEAEPEEELTLSKKKKKVKVEVKEEAAFEVVDQDASFENGKKKKKKKKAMTSEWEEQPITEPDNSMAEVFSGEKKKKKKKFKGGE